MGSEQILFCNNGNDVNVPSSIDATHTKCHNRKMVERLRRSPEVLTPNMNPVNEEMHALLNLYLPKRKPLALEDYDWDAIRPDLVDPDLLQCLRFVAEVESNPEAPAQNLLGSADRSGATWQRRFIEDTWLPEEQMHGVLLRECAIRYGAVTQPLIDAEIERVRQRGFPIGANYTSLKANIYGWMQEDTTWKFYQAMLSRARDPTLKTILNDIAKQENFHRHVYFQGAKTTLEYNPNVSREVVEAVSQFVMPGHHMTPDLQRLAPYWAKKFSFPSGTLLLNRVNGLVELIGYEGLGEAIIAYGAKGATPWYVKAPLYPLSMLNSSHANHIIGKKIADAVRKKG